MTQNHDKDFKLVPDYIRNLKPYQAGKPIDELMREKNLTRVTKLASNENPLGPSPFALKEMTKALWDVHRYPDMHAHELKTSLCQIYGLKKENIVLGNGSEGIMGYIVRAFLGPDQEFLTSEKTFIGMIILARSVGAKIIQTPMTDDYRFNIQLLKEKISAKTKIIYIANPNNPTGTILRKQEFDELMKHVPSHVLVVLDEAYFEFAKHSADYPDSMDYRYDNVITLRTFSKAYGLAGVRVGYGFGHEDLMSNLNKIKLPFEPGLIAQKAAIGALHDQPHLQRTLEVNQKEYQRLKLFLNQHKLSSAESFTNFVLIRTFSAEASQFIYEELLNLGVIIRPLVANEMSDFVRISLGTAEEMDHFYEAFLQILPALKKKHPAVFLN